MAHNDATSTFEGIQVRSYQPKDQAMVAHLYTAGLLAGQIAPNDTGVDIEDIEQAYFDEDRHHFWVAELGEQVVGMIGVASDEPHTAEVRRLRILPEHQNSPIAEKLLRTALQHCKHHGYLKVMLNTRFEHDAAVDLFDRIGFQHTRTRSHQEKELLEFYLDLYRQSPDDQQARGEGEGARGRQGDRERG